MLKIEDVEWNGQVFLDLNFRSFYFEGSFYKATLQSNSNWGRQKSASSFLGILAKEGFIPHTEPCDLTIEHCGPIYRQYSEVFNLHPEFTCVESRREAGILFCKFNLWLFKRGMGLHDGHCDNIVFQGPMTPRWCDIGSIVNLSNKKPLMGIEQFARYYVYPLLMRQKYPHFERYCRLMTRHYLSHDAANELGFSVPLPHDREKALIFLLELLENLEFSTGHTIWSDYYKSDYTFSPPKDSSPYLGREKLFTRIIESLKPSTVVDLGANAGRFSRYMASLGAEVLALEPDELAVLKNHKILRDTEYQHKIKLMLSAIGDGPKLQGELATALALTHHLFFTNGYPWKYIAKLLASYTSKDLLTEFMPNGLGVNVRPNYLPENYRLECFSRHLERHFARVEILDYPVKQGDSPRVFLLCRDKRDVPLDDGWGPWPHDD